MRTENNPVVSRARIACIVIPTLLLMTCLFTFFPALDNYFLLDDGQWLLMGKRSMESAGGMFQWVGGAYFEPVLNFIFAVFFYFFQLHPSGYYAMNIFLHAVNSVVLYSFSLMLLPREKAGAFLASLMFVVLYAHHQPVLWIAAFVHLVSTLFLMICFILFVLYVRTKRTAYYFLCLAGFLVCLFTKESTVMLPVAFSLYFLLSPERKAPVKWQKLLPFFLFAFAYFAFFHLRGMTWQTTYGGWGYTLGLHFLPTLVSCSLEILLSTLGYVIFQGRPEGGTVLFVNAILLLFLLISVVLRSGKVDEREKNVGRCVLFGVLFFFIMLLPFSFFQELLGYGSHPRYRYLYLPSVGFCLSFGHFLSFILSRIMREKKLKWSAFIFVGVVLNILFFNVKYVKKTESYYSMYGRISENVVGQIGSFIANRKPAKLVLLDFPETPVLAISKPHIMGLVGLYYGEKWQVFMLRAADLKTFFPDKNVYLVYHNGKIKYYKKKR